jgi:hypothetical protein
MQKTLLTTVALAAALGFAAPSFATVAVAGSGWQGDEVDGPATPSLNSPITFSVAAGQTGSFAVTDAFLYGDTYTVVLNGVDVFTTTLGVTATPFDNNLGPAASYAAPAWNDPSYSKLLLTFGQGDYSFVITGDCGGGCPAGFAYRFDLASVPEPASWALMLAGFGLVGATVRASRRREILAA